MSDHAATGQWDSATTGPFQPRGAEDVERYETDEGVVFFDSHNPLAWLEATQTIPLEDNL